MKDIIEFRISTHFGRQLFTDKQLYLQP